MILPDSSSQQQGRVLRRGGNTGPFKPTIPTDPGAPSDSGGVTTMPAPTRIPGRPGSPYGGGSGPFIPEKGTPQRGGGRPGVPPAKPKPEPAKEDPYAAARWRKEHPWLFPNAGGGSAPPPMSQTVSSVAAQPQLPPAVVIPRMEGFGMDGGRGMIGRY